MRFMNNFSWIALENQFSVEHNCSYITAWVYVQKCVQQMYGQSTKKVRRSKYPALFMTNDIFEINKNP